MFLLLIVGCRILKVFGSQRYRKCVLVCECSHNKALLNGELKQQKLISLQFWTLDGWDQGGKGWFSQRPFFSACQWLSSPFVLMGLPWVLISFLGHSHVGLDRNHPNDLILTYFSNKPVSKCSHTVKGWDFKVWISWRHKSRYDTQICQVLADKGSKFGRTVTEEVSATSLCH